MEAALTICITTYNRWVLCERAINSILAQRGVKIKLVVVDDCSDQPIPGNLLKNIKKHNGAYVRHQRNKGLAAARNTAISYCLTQWFAFCDDDDAWPDHMAENMMGIALDGDCHDVVLALDPRKRSDYESKFQSRERLRNLILGGVTPPVGSQMYNIGTLGGALTYCEKIKSGVDHDLWINLVYECDPIVSVAWCGGAIVGSECGSSRMTRNKVARRNGIELSLNHWKDKLSQVFGTKFYEHFCRCYHVHINRVFFIDSVRSIRIASVVQSFFSIDIPPFIFKVILRGNPYRHKCNTFDEYDG